MFWLPKLSTCLAPHIFKKKTKNKKQENNQCLIRCYLSLCKHLTDTCKNVYIYFKNASITVNYWLSCLKQINLTKKSVKQDAVLPFNKKCRIEHIYWGYFP